VRWNAISEKSSWDFPLVRCESSPDVTNALGVTGRMEEKASATPPERQRCSASVADALVTSQTFGRLLEPE
jgi:hypothetical protein